MTGSAAPLLDPLAAGPFRVVARRRPVALVQPGTTLPLAPCAAVEAPSPSDAEAVVGLAARTTELRAHLAGGRTWLEVEHDGRTTRHESRRHARTPRADALALALTGDLVTVLTRDAGTWRARALTSLAEPYGPDVHEEGWLGALRPVGEHATAGTFGQLGLRDPRLVSHLDATPVTDAGSLLLTATSAGPGGFRSGHTSVWSLHPVTLELTHRADLFFRRPDRSGVFTDHATHLVREEDHWLVATSSWGDFDQRDNPRVEVTTARSTADLLRGTHVLDTTALALPTTGLTSVGAWDPHLVRVDGEWLVGFVSAREWFRFHPVLAAGPDLASLRLRAAAPARTACEGTTLLPTADGWLVAASHGRDGAADVEGRAATYPVLDLDLREVGVLDAVYPSNLSWPTLAPTAAGPLLVGFDGTPLGGPLLGYGTHGDLVLQRGPAPWRSPG